MNLLELKQAVNAAIRLAREYGKSPDEVSVSLQIDFPSGAAVWVSEGVEMHHHNDGYPSDCFLMGHVKPDEDREYCPNCDEVLVMGVCELGCGQVR